MKKTNRSSPFFRVNINNSKNVLNTRQKIEEFLSLRFFCLQNLCEKNLWKKISGKKFAEKLYESFLLSKNLKFRFFKHNTN
jgi:hypothetical protein